jgi:hypothetical protein
MIFISSAGIGRWSAFLVPRRLHPGVVLLFGGQRHRHCSPMDRLDNVIRRCCQKSVNQVRAGGRLRLRAAVTVELGPDAAESEQRPILIALRIAGAE